MNVKEKAANRLRNALKELSFYGFSGPTQQLGDIMNYIDKLDPPEPKLPDGVSIGYNIDKYNRYPVRFGVYAPPKEFSVDEIKAIVYHLNKTIEGK